MIDVLVMYPNRDGMRFDDGYYLGEHAALVARLLDGYGMRFMRVAKGSDTGSPYYIVTHLGFDSLEGFQTAIDAVGSTIFEDIPRFTDVEPLIQVGHVLVNHPLS